MSESARRIERYIQRDVPADMGPQGLPRHEMAEARTPLPDPLVATGDANLTFDTLLATRDALCRQAEDLSSLVQVYDRAIAARGKSGERAIPRPPVASHGDHAVCLPPPAGQSARPLPTSLPAAEAEPSMIVCMQSFSPEPVNVTSSGLSPIKADPPRPSRSREAATETIRFRLPGKPRRDGGLWTAAIGAVLLGLTVWAWLDISAASSGESSSPTRARPPVATPAAVERTPLILPFVVPAPVKNAALPGVSLSHFDVVWGDAPAPRVRAALRRSISKMGVCLAQVSPDALELPDKLELSLRLREGGVVKWVRGGDRGGSRPVRTCIESAFYSTVFPPSKKGLQVNTGLVFTPR